MLTIGGIFATILLGMFAIIWRSLTWSEKLEEDAEATYSEKIKLTDEEYAKTIWPIFEVKSQKDVSYRPLTETERDKLFGISFAVATLNGFKTDISNIRDEISASVKIGIISIFLIIISAILYDYRILDAPLIFIIGVFAGSFSAMFIKDTMSFFAKLRAYEKKLKELKKCKNFSDLKNLLT